MKDIKVLFIPDVHCRDFWKEPVKKTLEENPEAKIIFLGDYVDGYGYEFGEDVDYQTYGYENFLELVELKKKNKDRITLLIGNHDSTYAIGDDICRCRTDYKHKQLLENIFLENVELFKLADETRIKDKHFIFSHAGISKGWVDFNFHLDLNLNENIIVDFLNNMWLTQNYEQLNTLGEYDKFRGWGGYTWGSPIWADINGMYNLTEEQTYGDFQIVGHTQLSVDKPLIFDKIGDFDCRRCFYIDSEANIRIYDTDEICEKTKQKNSEN